MSMFYPAIVLNESFLKCEPSKRHTHGMMRLLGVPVETAISKRVMREYEAIRKTTTEG